MIGREAKNDHKNDQLFNDSSAVFRHIQDLRGRIAFDPSHLEEDVMESPLVVDPLVELKATVAELQDAHNKLRFMLKEVRGLIR